MTIEELKDKIEVIKKIFMLAQSSFLIVDYYRETELSNYCQVEKRKSRYFLFSHHIFWRTTVIELSKLLKEKKYNNKYSVKVLINDLKRDRLYDFFGIEYSVLEKWEDELDAQKAAIDNIILQRDKLYAHTDTKDTEIMKTTTFKQTNDILHLLGSVIIYLYDKIHDGYIAIHNVIGEPVEDYKFIIKKLGEWREHQEDKYKGMK